jgi:hypothetical protein
MLQHEGGYKVLQIFSRERLHTILSVSNTLSSICCRGKNEWTNTSPSRTRLHGVDKENCVVSVFYSIISEAEMGIEQLKREDVAGRGRGLAQIIKQFPWRN